MLPEARLVVLMEVGMRLVRCAMDSLTAAAADISEDVLGELRLKLSGSPEHAHKFCGSDRCWFCGFVSQLMAAWWFRSGLASVAASFKDATMAQSGPA